MALPLQFGQEFRADVCSEGVDTSFFWSFPAANIRYHSQLRVDFQRFPRDRGFSQFPLEFAVPNPANLNQLFIGGGDCSDFYAPSGHCGITTGFIAVDYVQDVLLAVTAKGVDGGTPYLASPDILVTHRPACEWDPGANTSELTAAEAFNPVFNGRVLCNAGTTYFWRHRCMTQTCQFIGTFADEAHRRTDFNVEVTSPTGNVPCPMVDGGRFACSAPGMGDGGYNYVQVTAALDGGVFAIPSEYLNLATP